MNPMRPCRSNAPMALTALIAFSACSGASGPARTPRPAPRTASEAEWREMALPRTQAMPGAARVSVGKIELLGGGWGMSTSLDPSFGVTELVVAGLLRRADVNFVERRRFEAAATAERQQRPRPAAAPAAGVSPGAEFILSGSWSSVGLDSAYLDLRLTVPRTGAVVTSWRAATADDADPTSLARRVVGSLLQALDDMDRRPAWSDSERGSAPSSYQATTISIAAVEAFMRGLASEERWDWEGARMGYQAALARSGGRFPEASAALARTARLRSGGTLGVSQ